MKLKKLFVIAVITLILNVALGVTALATDPHAWSVQPDPDTIITLPK